MKIPKLPDLSFERAAYGVVAGIDEAGYAPLAGPVVAAAVVLPQWVRKPRALHGLNDSKQVPRPERERLYAAIIQIARFGVGIATVGEIDMLNIYQANMLAMRRAVADLGITIDTALIDGNRKPGLACHMTTIIKGDARSLSIAAASVIAKVTRDRIMHRLAETYPGYGWETNVGYGTDEHYLALLRLGPTSEHRRSFAPNLFFSSSDTRFRCHFAAAVSARLERLQLLQLRADLHAVFDAGDSHIGVLKWLHGGWFFKAIGYSASGEALVGAGPLAAFHNRAVAEPHAPALLVALGA
ncbi:MAG: ribonuclease HII [Gammaproteobacteria bacterium]